MNYTCDVRYLNRDGKQIHQVSGIWRGACKRPRDICSNATPAIKEHMPEGTDRIAVSAKDEKGNYSSSIEYAEDIVNGWGYSGIGSRDVVDDLKPEDRDKFLEDAFTVICGDKDKARGFMEEYNATTDADFDTIAAKAKDSVANARLIEAGETIYDKFIIENWKQSWTVDSCGNPLANADYVRTDVSNIAVTEADLKKATYLINQSSIKFKEEKTHGVAPSPSSDVHVRLPGGSFTYSSKLGKYIAR